MWNHTSKHTAMISSEIYVFFFLPKEIVLKSILELKLNWHTPT